MQNLSILMGWSPDSIEVGLNKIEEKFPAITPIPFGEVLARRADYETATVKVEKMQYARKAALSKFNPQLSAGISGGWGTLQPNMSGPVKFNTITALSLSAPLYRWNERGQTKKLQNAYINISELDKSTTYDAILKEFSNATTDMNESWKQVTVAEENMEVAQQSLDLNTFSYNEGRSSIVEVLSAQLSWIQAQTNLISAYVNNKMAIAEYRRVISE